MNDSMKYQFSFKRHIDINDVEDTLTLSIIGAETLYGRSRVRLDGWWCLDRQRRSCIIDGSTQVGQDIARLVTGFLTKEFGDNSFRLLRDSNRKRSDTKAEAS